MFKCFICDAPIEELDILYWVGPTKVTPNKTLQKIIEIPFCSPEHSLEYHKAYEAITK